MKTEKEWAADRARRTEQRMRQISDPTYDPHREHREKMAAIPPWQYWCPACQEFSIQCSSEEHVITGPADDRLFQLVHWNTTIPHDTIHSVCEICGTDYGYRIPAQPTVTLEIPGSQWEFECWMCGRQNFKWAEEEPNIRHTQKERKAKIEHHIAELACTCCLTIHVICWTTINGRVI